MRALVMLSVLLVGCADASRETCTNLPAIATALPLMRGYAGVASKHTLKVNCVRPNEKATAVVVTLADPRGEPVPFTVSAPIPNSNGGFTAELEFTPMEPGFYPVTARFEPSLGTLTDRIIVIRDRRAELPSRVVTTPEMCDSVEVAGDLLGCTSASRQYVLHDGGVLFTEAPAQMRAGGSALWSWNRDGVARATSSQRLTSATQRPWDVASVSATTESLVLAESGQLVEYAVSENAIERRLLLGDAGVGEAVVPVDGGWVSATKFKICFVSLSDSPQCAESVRDVIGAERNGIWLKGTPGPSDVVYVAFGPSPRPVLSVELNLSTAGISQPLELSSSARLPLFNGTTTVNTDTLTLEEWPIPGKPTPTHFLGIQGSTVLIFER